MVANETLIPEETLRLREYLGVLARRKWSIIAITLLAVLAALFYAQQQTPIYQSTAEVQATTPLAVQQAGTAVINMDTEQQFVSSSDVTKCASIIVNQPTFRTDLSGTTLDLGKLCAADQLAKTEFPAGLDKHLSVTFPQQATVLQISYSDPLKAKAQAGAQAFALAYVEVKTQQAEQQLDKLRKPLLDAQRTYATQIAGLNTKITDLLTSLAGQKVDASNQGQIANLQAQVNVAQQQLNNVVDSLRNLDPSKVNPPQLLLPARVPASPVSPNKILDGALGLFVGLAFGVGLAFVRERLDDSLRSRVDLEENIGAPVLAVIPKVPGWKKKQEPKLVSLDQPKSAVAETYRTLRTSVLFTAAQRGVKTLIVCSPTAGEGKTTTAANLAVTLADANKRVILVSADLRKPRLHRFFGLSNDVGLSNCLIGEVKPWEALQDPRVENLRVMSSGPIPARPTELLQSEQMGELLSELREVADFVIIDTAPVLLVADALTLAPLADGVLVVADAESTSRSATQHAREQLEQVGASIVGAIYNNFDPSKGRSYYPYTGYYGPYRYRYGRYDTSYEAAPKNGGKGGEAEERRPLEAPQER